MAISESGTESGSKVYSGVYICRLRPFLCEYHNDTLESSICALWTSYRPIPSLGILAFESQVILL